MSEEKSKLGEILVRSGAISLKELETFLQQQEELKTERGYQTRLGSLLLEHELVNEETLAMAFGIQQDVEYQSVDGFQPDLKILEAIPYSILENFKFVPLFMDSQKLIIAIHDPVDTFLFDLLYKALGISIDIRSSTRSGIDAHHKACLVAAKESGRINEDFDVDFEEYRLILQQEKGAQKPIEKEEVTLKNTLSHMSLEDIIRHTTLELQFTAVHFKKINSQEIEIKGKRHNSWHYFGSVSDEAFQAMFLRAKTMAGFKQSIGYLSQGFIEIPFSENDCRQFNVLLLPAFNGFELIIEEYVDNRLLCLQRFGLLPQDYKKICDLDFTKGGALILGGETSGKTSLMHGLINSCLKDKLTITIEEDPQKNFYQFPQLQLDTNRSQFGSLASLSTHAVDAVAFDSLYPQEIHSTLRVLPKKACLITSQAGAVFPTLASLEKQGENLGSILSRLHFVISLKLVPGLCPYCAQPHPLKPAEVAQMGIKPETLKKPSFYYSGGCEYCENRGYMEFTPIYELLWITPQTQKLLQENPLGNEVAMHLLKTGNLTPMNNVAKEKLYRGFIGIQTYAQILQKKI